MINKEKNIRITITVPRSLDDLTNKLLRELPKTSKSRLYVCAIALLLQSPANGDKQLEKKGETK